MIGQRLTTIALGVSLVLFGTGLHPFESPRSATGVCAVK